MKSSRSPFRVSIGLMDEALVDSLKVLANQYYGDEGGSSCDYTPTLKSVRALYIVNILQR